MHILKLITVALLFIMSAPTWAQHPAYYYKGRQKVEVKVLTDTVAFSSDALTTPVRSRISARFPDSRFEKVGKLPGKAILKIKGNSLDQLQRHADQSRSVIMTGEPQAVLARGEESQELQTLTDSISFKTIPRSPVQQLVKIYHLTDVKPVPFAADTYTARVDSAGDLLGALNTANRMQESGDVEWASPLIDEKDAQRSLPNDPLFLNQWHLRNIGSNTIAGTAGNDINVVPAWGLVTGAGVNIAITDDGLETTHPDLMANVRMDLNYDFNFMDNDPTPYPFHSHGTGCAGVAAGRWNNNVGITGVAPEAGLAGLRLLAEEVTDLKRGLALSWKYDVSDPHNQIAVQNNSWGPDDTGTVVSGPGPLAELALQTGVTEGRNGKGIVYVWAAGNGRHFHDNINKDGWANSPYVIAVGATTSNGVSTYYSEPGSAMLINAPSGNYYNEDMIYTTDLAGSAGSNTTGDYRSNFGGTSSSAPTVAGVVALMLQANPSLTYRDVMHILVQSASKNDPTHIDWRINGAGREFNHNYGFGRVNAEAAVTQALTWQNVPASAPVIEVPGNLSAPITIPDYDSNGILRELTVNAPPEFVVEHVEIEADITHNWRGDIALLLQSPSGMVSDLILTQQSVDNNDNYSNWRFRSVAHWGENPTGTWRLLVADLFQPDIGTLNSYTLRLRGFLSSASSVDLWNLY